MQVLLNGHRRPGASPTGLYSDHQPLHVCSSSVPETVTDYNTRAVAAEHTEHGERIIENQLPEVFLSVPLWLGSRLFSRRQTAGFCADLLHPRIKRRFQDESTVLRSWGFFFGRHQVQDVNGRAIRLAL